MSDSATRSILYFNATFHTLDREGSEAAALFTTGSRIEAIGSRDEVEVAVSPGTERIDLEGGTVFPGFNDCHCHILSFGLALQQLDVSRDAVRNIADVLRTAESRARSTPTDQWVIGRGYDQNWLEERRDITRHDLDSVSAQHPVVLWHTSGHGLTCNSAALQIAGITHNTPTPPGSEIDRDGSGHPTGVLKESPATDLVAKVIPPPSVEEGTQAVISAMEVMSSQGITSATDAATGQGESIDDALQIARRVLASGSLQGRVTLMPQIRFVAPSDSSEARTPTEFDEFRDSEWLQIGATKIFSDGALTTRTAALRRPFVDSEDNRGLFLWEPEVLSEMILRAHNAGWQIATHAIGDHAIELVIECYERALETTPRVDHRHRIEHCMLLDEHLARRIARLKLVPTIQPGFISRLGDAYITGLGVERACQLNPMQLFQQFGIQTGFSSDRPVIPGQPLEGIRAAVSRRTPEGVILGAHHSISVKEAIGNYTLGSAFAGHQEKDRGTLTPGKLADFVVLSRDPRHTPLDEWQDVEIKATVVGGQKVYQKT